MTIDPLTSAIVGHLVGDYLIQNDWMAGNKKKPGHDGRWACMIHCVLWTWSVCLFAGITNPLAWAFLFICHFVQDRTNIVSRWMAIIRQDNFSKPPLAPWSLIVVDNVWHILQILIAIRFLC